MKQSYKTIQRLLRNRRVARKLQGLMMAFTCIIVFVTTYALILPALTLEKGALICGMEVHEHDGNCYTDVLTCALQESEGGHEHTDSCYERQLICGKEQHVHVNSCYEERQDANEESTTSDESQISETERQDTNESRNYDDESQGINESRNSDDESQGINESRNSDDESQDTTESRNSEDESQDTNESRSSEDESQNPEEGTETSEEDHNVAESQTSEEMNDDSTEESKADAPEDTVSEGIKLEDYLREDSGLWYQTENQEWKAVEEDTILAPSDNLLVRLAYHLPEGNLSIDKNQAVYELPDTILLNKEETAFINKEENALNQVISGTRLPEQSAEEYPVEEYLAGNYQLDRIENPDADSDTDNDNNPDADPDNGRWNMTITWNDYAIQQNETAVAAGWLMFYIKASNLQVDENGNGEVVFARESTSRNELKEKYTVRESEDSSEETSKEETNEDINEEETTESISEETNEADTTENSSEETNGEETTEDSSEETSGEETTDRPAQSFISDTDYVTVNVAAPAGAFPAGTTMSVSDVIDQATVDTIADSVLESEGTQKNILQIHAVDITFYDTDGQKIEPDIPIQVVITPKDSTELENTNASPVIVHVEDNGNTEVLEQKEVEDTAAEDTAEDAAETIGNVEKSKKVDIPIDENSVVFDADTFSIYAIAYTVDFYWEVNGKTYEFSIPGGGFVSLEHLVEALGIASSDSIGYQNIETVENNIYKESIHLNNVLVSEETKQFVAEVANVEFSSPELVWIGKAEDGTTIGQLKEGNQLNVQYSAELTEEQIKAINTCRVESGDWALISVQPFISEETLTVTMKDGEVFTVKVTDAQITTSFLSDNGNLYEVTVTYDETANIPEGSTLQVTEFSEEDAEYEYARKSVLADKQARGEGVDLNSFCLAALDISILNPEEVEIEPEAPVQVNIRIKKLPGVENLDEIADTLAIQHHVEVEDGVVVETVYDGSAEASFKLETDETVVEEGIVVEPESVKEEDFNTSVPMENDGLEAEFEAEAFSTFTISWNYAYGNGTKIHYVDEEGNELTVKNTTFPDTIGEYSTSPAYLIYDIEGYEYSYTYYNDGYNNYNILPLIDRDKNGWGYYTLKGYSYYLDRNRDIYVVYKKKLDIVQGGTPTVKQSGSANPPVAPRINKESTPNGDDTNTLALSLISDTAKLEVEKLADVIVVFDVSGSMEESMGDKSRLKAAQQAVNSLAEHLAEKKNSNGEPLVRMSLIQFSTKADPVIGLTELTKSGLAEFEKKVNRLTASGGTNWDHALQLANEENDLDEGRATFVIFVTDGDPTFRNTRMDVTDLDLQGETNDRSLSVGWENPNMGYLSDAVYGPGDNDKTGQCYEAAVLQGNAIVSAGKNIYTIGISNDVTKVNTFNSDIKGNGAYLASNATQLQKAFSDIEASISGVSGWGNIKMTDGITNLTNTVQKTGLTNVGGDFSYWRAPAPDNWSSMTETQKNAYKPAASDFVSWDPVAADAAPAVYNKDTGAVEWNMGSNFIPEAGVTYQVRFKVWPSQEAYDYIAKLNNDTIKYDELPADVKAQIIKNGSSYTLKTNEPDAKMTYQSAIKSGSTVTVSGETKSIPYPKVADLNLSTDKIKVKKEWINSLDPDARWKSPVTLLLTDGAGNLYRSIDLNENNGYSAEDNYISCGLAKIEKGELIIYEKGHDFKLTEPKEYAYHWDLDSQIYRPMIIDAKLTMLMKVDAPSGMGEKTYHVENGNTYYKIDGGTYKAISEGDAAAAITATNVRRSNLNLTKKVVDDKGNPVSTSELFTFTITINSKKEEQVWFSVQTDANDTNTIVKNLTTNAIAEVTDGEKTGFYHANSGSGVTVSLQPGWNLRFTNLPIGTTYTITEETKENYTFKNASIDNNGTFSVENDTTTGNGTITESNKQYTVTYTNTAVTQQVYIKKTTQDAQTPLQGAVFSLYSKDGYEADPPKALKTDLKSDENGKIDLGRLVVGNYYLVETSAPDGYITLSAPVEITVANSGVTYQQSDSNLGVSNKGVIHQNETNTYTLTVTNNAGYELPSTGGPGSARIYLLGFMLASLAGTGLTGRRRKKNAA